MVCPELGTTRGPQKDSKRPFRYVNFLFSKYLAYAKAIGMCSAYYKYARTLHREDAFGSSLVKGSIYRG